MRRRHLTAATSRVAIAALGLWIGAGACAVNVSEPLDPTTVSWATYTDEELGFTLRYPDAWTPRRVRGFVVFLDATAAPMRVQVMSRDEASRRGYWGRNEPLAAGRRGQASGELFRYRHFDGPIYDPFLTWVVPHRGAELAVELRTRNRELDAVQAAILDSLVLQPL